MKVLLLLSSFLLAFCQTANSETLLRWKVEDNESIKYKTTMLPIKIDQRFALNGFDVLNNEQLQQQIKTDLNSFLTPEDSLITTLTKNKMSKGFRVRTTRLSSEDTNRQPESTSQVLNDWAGPIELLGDLDDRGNVESFYLSQKQRNILVQMFSIPLAKVKTGDSWTLPTNLIEIGHNFVPTLAQRKTKVTFDSKEYNKNGDLIAKLFYVMAESVNGQFEDPYSDKIYPSKFQYTYLAYADFNVSKGRWEKHTGVSYILIDNEKKINEHMIVYALNKF